MMVLTYFMCAVLLSSAVMVIVSRSPLNSVLYLVASFLSASMLLFLFENEFLALFFSIIYLGAIAILFQFIVFYFAPSHFYIKALRFTLQALYFLLLKITTCSKAFL